MIANSTALNRDPEKGHCITTQLRKLAIAPFLAAALGLFSPRWAEPQGVLQPSLASGPQLVFGGTPQSGLGSVSIDCSDARCKQRLLEALNTPNTTVYVRNHVALDLSSEDGIRIREGVKLVGGRDARHVGPLLFTTTRPKRLFRIQGDNVRITGLRIRGPELGIGEGDDNVSRSIVIDLSALGGRPFGSSNKIEIDNNELYGWSGAAIRVQDYDESSGTVRVHGKINGTNVDAVHIHDNFIHHNQHEGKQGYGVVLADGAYALIERNVFDFNRHAIAADGREGTGYKAYKNLILKGGGVHRCVAGNCTYTHQFDMHGRDDCGFWDLFSDTLFNCGLAGEYMDIRYNSFQYTNDNAFRLRGTPKLWDTPGINAGAFVVSNVFAHDDLDGALSQTESGLHTQGNIVGVDTLGEYGVGDFDGDGRDDLFLATGRTWWYSSSGKMHWVYLNTSSKRLHEVALGNFDDDKRCDVFTTSANQWVISSGGMSAWTPVETSSIPFDKLRFGDFDGNGRTDVFRANGSQWYFASPGLHGWIPLAQSAYPVEKLRFGNFDNDGKTDVFSLANGQWSVSSGGISGWQRLNAPLSTSLNDLVFADIDDNGVDDVLFYERDQWKVSRDGRTGWETLHHNFGSIRIHYRNLFWGRFDTQTGTDGLVLDASRYGYVVSSGRGSFVLHSLHPY
jgi:hypothetical protein